MSDLIETPRPNIDNESGRCKARTSSYQRTHSFKKSELQASYAGSAEQQRISWIRRSGLAGLTPNSNSGIREEQDPPRCIQYKLTSINTKVSGPFGLYSAITDSKDDPFLTAIFEWSFHTSYLNLILAFMAIYTFLSIFFALLIMISHLIFPDCVVGPDKASSSFMDAFSLSWATFSTVGYGHIRPNTAAELSDGTSPFSCSYTNIIVAIEAFIGILFAGFCGAILFTKTLKSQREAHVIFSDPVCVHFRTSTSFLEDEIPCPVMEFRIINKLSNKRGGEIIDAKIKCLMAVDCVKQTDAPQDMEVRRSILSAQTNSDECLSEVIERGQQDNISSVSSDLGSVRGETELIKTTHTDRRLSRTAFLSRKNKKLSYSTPNNTNSLKRYKKRSKITMMRIRSKPSLRINQQTFGEAAIEGGTLLEHRTSFSNLKMDFDEHPFFSRAWVVNHPLDINSPLLKDSAKRFIRENNGSWPYSMNNPNGIRGAIKNFDRLIMSISGTSNSSASEVFSRKVYSFVDIVIGYRFTEVTWIDSSGGLKVDFNMANVVRGQKGGGGEPL